MCETLHFVDACTEAHFSAMSHIHAMGWHAAYQGAVPAEYLVREVTDERWTPIFRKNYRLGRYHGLLLFRGDTPVCCGNYGPARGPEEMKNYLVSFPAGEIEGCGEIVSFYTHPVETSKGYGSLLMEEILRRLKAEFRSCYVFVLRENSGARRFYERHGFSWDGASIDIPFPPDQICVDLRYYRDL